MNFTTLTATLKNLESQQRNRLNLPPEYPT